MQTVRLSLSAALIAASCAAVVGPALAQAPIGQAARSEPNVTGVLGARRTIIASGSSVHQNETVQTNALGRALLEFRDSTHLSVGPGATVKLDRFVFNPDSTARQAVISMSRGTFRFVTGASPSSAFSLRTPHATIGVRGTIIEFAISAARTNIAVIQGAIVACPRGLRNRTDCLPLGAGQRASFTSAGAERLPVAPGGPDPSRGTHPGGDSPGGSGSGGSSRG